MFSKKTKYGLQALFFLARKYQQGPVLISDLAHAEHIPQKFLEAILLELKNQGILQSKKGKGGGYALSRSPDEIMLGEVIRALEGPITQLEQGHEETFEIKHIIKEVTHAMSNVLDRTSLSDSLQKAQAASGQLVENYII